MTNVGAVLLLSTATDLDAISPAACRAARGCCARLADGATGRNARGSTLGADMVDAARA
jgi:hypothetical protein